MRWFVTMVMYAMLVAGCAEAGPAGGSSAPQPLPDPVGERQVEELGGEPPEVRIWPRSASVEEDVPYRMVAYTHCGLDHALDFDGSFWEVDAGPEEPWTVLDDPEDEGVITLVAPAEAVFESAAGGRFQLRRVDGPRDVHLCE